MEPFIQLNYGERCHRKSSQLKETSFIDNTKVPELFWIDLLGKKCQEGLGEVSEHLLNDENLTPDDFLSDQHSGLGEHNNNCQTSSKPGECQEFKTPLALRNVHKSFETPCLFSQDELLNITPTSSQKCNEHVRTQSFPTCGGDTQFAHGSSSTSQGLCTPAALSRHRSVGEWSKKTAKTPDLLAEIMGQGRSSLSYLLARSDDEEIAEWSESMATPPLKITRPPADDDTDDNDEAEETVGEEECQPSSKRIARVLFSGSSTNQSLEPLEQSTEDATSNQRPLDLLKGKKASLTDIITRKNANGETDKRVATADDTSIHEEFLLEYSCYSDSKCQDGPENVLEQTLVASPSSGGSNYDHDVTSTPVVNISKPDYSEPCVNPNSSHSPFPDKVFSPSGRTPLRALAQSTPKPNFLVGSTGFSSVRSDRSITEELDQSLCDGQVLTGSPSRSCEKAFVRALCDVTCHTLEVDSKHDTSHVPFGSPSRSFELAMACETDKLSSGKERDTRTSGLGSSVCSTAQLPFREDTSYRTTRFQSTEAPNRISEKTIRKGTVTESTAGRQITQVTRTTTAITLYQASITTTGNPTDQTKGSDTNPRSPNNPAGEISPGSVNDRGGLIRRKSFCKAPGLRRSAGTKQFSYPVASQASKEDKAKRFREENWAVNKSCVFEKDKAPVTDESGVAACDKNLGDKVVSNMTCDGGEVPVAKRLKIYEQEPGCDSEKEINAAEKDDVLFDMDTLSQFPVDCIMSPSSLDCDSDFLNADASLSMARHEMNVTYTIAKDETQDIGEEIDPLTTSLEDDVKTCLDEKIVTKREKSYEKREGEEEPGSVYLQVVNCRASSTFSVTMKTESTHRSNSNLMKPKDKHLVMDLSNSSTFGLVKSDDVIQEFEGFHTASGKRVLVSSEALAKAKATMEMVDSSLGVNDGLSEGPAEKSKSPKTKVPSAPSEVGSSCKPTTISNVTLPFSADEFEAADVKRISTKIPNFEERRLPAFSGFSTTSGKQVCVSEAAMKQARKTLREVDAELKINNSERSLKDLKDTVDDYLFSRISCSDNEVGSLLDFHEVSRVSIGKNLTASEEVVKKFRGSRPDNLDLCTTGSKGFEFSSPPEYSERNVCEVNTLSCVRADSIRTSEIESSGIENTGGIEAKLAENINDSLLEDLLNDCKKRRRYSMETINEERERNVQDISESSKVIKNFELQNLSSVTDNREDLNQENFSTERCLDAASRNEGTSGSVSVPVPTLKSESTDLNRIPDEDTTREAAIADRESVHGIHTAPAIGVKDSLIVDKTNKNQMKRGRHLQGKNKRVAFRTAGGKTVEISDDALEAAKSTMKKIDDEVFSEWQKDSRKTFSSSCDFETRFEDFANENDSKQVALSFSGFQTAGGKKVTLSEEALKAGREIMKRLSDDTSEDYLCYRNKSSSLLSTESGCRLVGAENTAVSKRSPETELLRLAKMKMEEETDGRSRLNSVRVKSEVVKAANPSTQHLLSEADNGSKPSCFSGFQTASGKRVDLTTSALQKGAIILEQVDKKLEQIESKTVSSNASLSGFSGFQTAAGKSVKVSKRSLEKGVAITRQIDSFLEDSCEKTKTSTTGMFGLSGFQTASEQNVDPSDSLEKRAAIMQQMDQFLERNRETSESNTVQPPVFAGFQTAAGKSVKICKESLEKGAAIMQQIDRSLEERKGESLSKSRSGIGFPGFQTARGKSVPLSKESLEKRATIMRQIDKFLEEGKGDSLSNSPSVTGFSGFTTANGQSVQLSKESLERRAMIMRQIDKSLDEGKEDSISNAPCTTGFSGFRTATGQSVKLSKESLERGAMIIQQIDNSLEESKDNNGHYSRSAVDLPGFQTGRGQRVKISKESLEKGRATMQRIDESLDQCKDISASSSRRATSFVGFQTASGHSVKLSQKSLDKGSEIMRQIDKSLENKADKGDPIITSCSGFSGFQTAGGKTVQISESALAKAKDTMAGIERELSLLSPENEDTGCKVVAERKSAHGESKAKAQAKSISEDTDNSCSVATNDNNDVNFKGFFTARNQRVLVSEEALVKARKLLQETDTHSSNSKTEQGTDASFHELTGLPVSAEAQDKSTDTPETSLSVEHDELVSREILESSEALLADESFMEVAEYLHDKQERSATGRKSVERRRPSDPSLERKNGISRTEVASGSKPVFSRRHSTPLHCSEDILRANQTMTRNGLKPRTTTPSGVLHDRRSRSFHIPLRARLSSCENIRSSGSSRRYNDTDIKTSTSSTDCNRYLKPLQALSPGCFKSQSHAFPRTSTPVNSATNRRTSGPRPQFKTPYRKQQATKDTSPLTRCSSKSGLPVDVSEGEVSEIKEPSPKKPRLSVANGTSNTRGTHYGDSSKAECITKPQPGFLSQVHRCNQRIKLRQFVGNSTPGRFSATELIELGVSPELLSVTSSNATSFRFDGKRYFSESVFSSQEGVRTEDGGILHTGTDGVVGLEEFQRALLSTPGVDKELISEEWIANHYRWIVWKLAAMEVAFPRHFAGRCLTPDWVLCQLKYRYDREIDNSNRSALKKILERDDVSSRTMVLCVSSFTPSNRETEDVTQGKSDKDGENVSKAVAKKTEVQPVTAVIELTDGWYGIRGLLDKPLTRLLNDRKLHVGQKLCIHGAELVGSDQAVSPLEAPSSLMLRLHANSTRRARWDAKLGFHSHTHAFPLPLASLFGDGGFTGCVDVIVLRQYPVQWMEKMPDGTNVFRNSRLEEREAKRFEVDRQERREKLFLKIQEDFEKEFRQPELEKRRSARLRRRSVASCDLKELHDGEEIYEALTQASDPDSVKEYLNESQVRALDDYRRLLQERKCAELQRKFERIWKEQENESQLQRNLVPLLKVRLTDYCKGQAKQNAVLSIWRPSEEVMHLLSEGSRLRIYHLTAAGVRFRQGASELQLSAARSTRYELLPSDPDVLGVSYMPRQVCSFDELRCSSSQQFSEVDLVGLVVFCSPLSSFSSSSSSVQTVYLSDEESNLVAVKFWGGLKAVAVEDLVKPRSFICCSNLTVRPDDRLQFPSLIFSELSSLTLKPRELHLRTALNKLQQNMLDLNLFMACIQNTLTSFLRPHRSSSSTNIKLNTVRMYGNSTITAPADWMQKHDSSDTLNTEERRDKESCSNFNDEEGQSSGVTQAVVSNRGSETAREVLLPSCEVQTALAVANTNVRALSRQTKRKLLDSIAEPPPLSPLPSPIPASVRREFKRPRRVGSSAGVPLEQ